MNYYNVKSLVAATKKPFPFKNTTSSFFIADPKSRHYIEPGFQKIDFPTERPTILLVSAVGATGKTALAEQLSHDTKLPLLDLGKHKPVGDNTLTGLLTSAFDFRDISSVFEGLSSGNYGVIIDGIDEGRSKTTEKAFEAFLDDLVKLCQISKETTFIMLGRTQVLEDCWAYLSDKQIPTALITISPFNMESAKQYIDIFTDGITSGYSAQYIKARDTILDKLGRAFTGTLDDKSEEFLSFIGYPPVLDAVVTLLKEEKNYYKLLEDLGDTEGANIEISLLHRIAEYILNRERNLKVIPNIIKPLFEDVPSELFESAIENAFSIEEQCIRLVGYSLRKTVNLSTFGDTNLDEKYEASLLTWLPEHPFITNINNRNQFRNAVFEALSLATLISSQNTDSDFLTLKNLLLDEYLVSHKSSYHLVYMLDSISQDHRIPINTIGPLISAAMEFKSVNSIVELHIDGPEWDYETLDQNVTGDIDLEVEILLGTSSNAVQSFSFHGEITPSSRLSLGSRLGGAFISVPCHVKLGGAYDIEMTTPIDITARSVIIDAKELVLDHM